MEPPGQACYKGKGQAIQIPFEWTEKHDANMPALTKLKLSQHVLRKSSDEHGSWHRGQLHHRQHTKREPIGGLRYGSSWRRSFDGPWRNVGQTALHVGSATRAEELSQQSSALSRYHPPEGFSAIRILNPRCQRTSGLDLCSRSQALCAHAVRSATRGHEPCNFTRTHTHTRCDTEWRFEGSWRHLPPREVAANTVIPTRPGRHGDPSVPEQSPTCVGLRPIAPLLHVRPTQMLPTSRPPAAHAPQPLWLGWTKFGGVLARCGPNSGEFDRVWLNSGGRTNAQGAPACGVPNASRCGGPITCTSRRRRPLCWPLD